MACKAVMQALCCNVATSAMHYTRRRNHLLVVAVDPRATAGLRVTRSISASMRMYALAGHTAMAR
jgi:hypothetical protein